MLNVVELFVYSDGTTAATADHNDGDAILDGEATRTTARSDATETPSRIRAALAARIRECWSFN